MEKLPITAAGHAALIEELRRRQQEDRPRIIQMIAEARAHGDLSENAEYHSAKEQQSLNEGRIAELEDKIARADVIDLSKLSGKTIKFGATVTLVDEDTDEEKKYMIVGETEADVKSGRVSITSPIARALIGKTVGDTVGSEHARRRQELRDPGRRVRSFGEGERYVAVAMPVTAGQMRGGWISIRRKAGPQPSPRPARAPTIERGSGEKCQEVGLHASPRVSSISALIASRALLPAQTTNWNA
ncbi:MAG: transcription elongation factor GreA [Rhodoblastus sp.]